MTKNDMIHLLALSVNSIVLVLAQAYGLMPVLVGSLLFTIYYVAKIYKTDLINSMLFMLPLAPLLKINPSGFSVFTIAFLVVAILFSYRIKFKYDPWILLITTILIFTTICAKLLHGYDLSLDYFVFFTYIIILPSYVHSFKQNLSFYKNGVYLSVGIIIASSLAYVFKNFSSLNDYIDLLDYTKQDLTRFSGFYGDPNYYSAQILVAITSLLVLILIGKHKNRKWLGVLVLILLILGLLSASKMFLSLLFAMSIVWLLALAIPRGKFSLRISVLTLASILIVSALTIGLFDETIRIYEARFENSTGISQVTTGRSDIAINYINYHISNAGYLPFGRGLTNLYLPELDFRAAHNTMIEIIYQLGVVGLLLLFAWVIRIFNILDRNKIIRTPVSILLTVCLMIGYFGPWLFLDMLYLDDFFFIIILFATSINFIKEMQMRNCIKPKIIMKGLKS